MSHRETESSCGIVTIAPGRDNLANVYPFQLALPAEKTALRVDSEVQAKQARSVSIEQIGQLLGLARLDPVLEKLDGALRLHLQL